MGYNKSKKVLEQVRPILDIVLAAGDKKIKIPSKFPTKLAMSIREGLKSAEDYEEESKYNDILTKFKLRTKADCIVFDPRSIVTFEDPIIELAQSLNILEVPRVNQLMQIVGACLKHKAPRIAFPDADLNDIDLAKLKKWCTHNNYEVEDGTAPLILIKKNGTVTTDSGTESSQYQQG